MSTAILHRYGINYLYHLTHIDNIASIYRHGLLSHSRAHSSGLVTRDISDMNVQDRRSNRWLGELPLHDYVPLYFTPRNPMLYRRLNIQDDIAILCMDSHLLMEEGTCFTDGNSASNGTQWSNQLEDLSQLDWNCIRGEYWTDFEDGRRKRCAEALVPNQIPANRIQRIYTRNRRAQWDVINALPHFVSVEARPGVYF